MQIEIERVREGDSKGRVREREREGDNKRRGRERAASSRGG